MIENIMLASRSEQIVNGAVAEMLSFVSRDESASNNGAAVGSSSSDGGYDPLSDHQFLFDEELELEMKNYNFAGDVPANVGGVKLRGVGGRMSTDGFGSGSGSSSSSGLRQAGASGLRGHGKTSNTTTPGTSTIPSTSTGVGSSTDVNSAGGGFGGYSSADLLGGTGSIDASKMSMEEEQDLMRWYCIASLFPSMEGLLHMIRM
ncbi:hypothetical protein HDU76_011077 [Blyttiomyces sp. JEL0837]|nr:hypothetical protein HDU76_011077 [Blyttiomyces sp. JEL0837]